MSKLIHVESTPNYAVVIEPGCLSYVSLWAKENGYRKALLITAAPVMAWARSVVDQLSATGVKTEILIVPDGEDAKTTNVLASTWDYAAKIGLERTDLVIGIGGGAITDFAGFFASTWLRGVNVVHVPTSLLAMVDASVGGKTGINTVAGKNLVGTFYAPQRVFIDPIVLQTLPNEEIKAGLAEVLKCGFIGDSQILELISVAHNLSWDSVELIRLIERAVTVKAKIVSADFKETGQREFLNYGHTLAHAIEKVSNYQVCHGEAVAIGMVFAAQLGHKLGLLSENWLKLHYTLIQKIGLPSTWNEFASQELFSAMLHDKKVRAGRLRFVFTTALEKENLPGDTWVREVDAHLVLETLEGN